MEKTIRLNSDAHLFLHFYSAASPFLFHNLFLIWFTAGNLPFIAHFEVDFNEEAVDSKTTKRTVRAHTPLHENIYNVK